MKVAQLFVALKLFFLQCALLQVAGKIDEDLFLSKCQCGKTAADPLQCDFSKLPKKKMNILLEKLLNHKIICVSDDWYYTPIFTASFNNQLKFDAPSKNSASAAVAPNGNVVQQVQAQQSSGSCEVDGLSCQLKGTGIEYLFPTVLLVNTLIKDTQTHQYNEQLKQLMLDLEEENDGCKFNLHGGYRSKDGFLNRKEPAVQWLKAQIIPRVQAMLGLSNSTHIPFAIEGWGAVLREGHGQGVHVHPASMFAGIYYVAAPREVAASGKSAGCLQFIDPRQGASMSQVVRGKNIYGETFEICPNEQGGLLALFPSWLMHEVKPMPAAYKGPRIGISFNVVYNPTGTLP